MTLNCYKFEFSDNFADFRGNSNQTIWKYCQRYSVETHWMYFWTLCSLRWFALHFLLGAFMHALLVGDNPMNEGIINHFFDRLITVSKPRPHSITLIIHNNRSRPTRPTHNGTTIELVSTPISCNHRSWPVRPCNPKSTRRLPKLPLIA